MMELRVCSKRGMLERDRMMSSWLGDQDFSIPSDSVFPFLRGTGGGGEADEIRFRLGEYERRVCRGDAC